MKKIRKQKAQSAAEFAVILPVFMLVFLGLIQLGLIYINVMMLKYTAYMTARVACVYDTDEIRLSKAQKAGLILKCMLSAADKYDNNTFINAWDGVVDLAKDAAASYMNAQADELKVEKESFENAKGGYIRVTVTYNMPLKIPFVNKIFGMFQNKNSLDLINTRTLAAYLNFPYYTLRAASIMRVQ